MGELLARLGLDSTPRRRRNLRARFARLGISTAHWDPYRGQIYSSDALRAAVTGSISYAGALRVLGIRPAGGSQAYLARRIRAEGIDTSHFLGQAHQRGRPSGRHFDPQAVLVVIPPDRSRTKTDVLRRALIAVGVPHVCATCGLGPLWRGSPLTLVVEHVSGDWSDNRQENLRFLCPNCHAQTVTWCRRLSARARTAPAGPTLV